MCLEHRVQENEETGSEVDSPAPQGGNNTGEESPLLKESKSWMTCQMTDGVPWEALKTHQ